MQGIKILIGVMTTLLFIGLGLLGYGFSVNFNKSNETPIISLPAGAKVLDIAAGDGFIALRTVEKDGAFIRVIDAKNGKVSKTIRLETAK